jgi:hypothetical protein
MPARARNRGHRPAAYPQCSTDGVDMGAEIATLTPTDDELRAAVGRRVEFYLRKWANTAHGGFNWAAFFLAGMWLPYRKMYRAAAVLYAVVIAESMLEELVFVTWLGWPETPRWVERGVAVGICWVCGSLGNRWYATHVARLIERARASQPEGEARLARLRESGGTSLLAGRIRGSRSLSRGTSSDDVRPGGNQSERLDAPRSNKRMKLTKLSAARGWLSTTVRTEVPPRARAGRSDAGTASQLIRGVRRTQGGALARPRLDRLKQHVVSTL